MSIGLIQLKFYACILIIKLIIAKQQADVKLNRVYGAFSFLYYYMLMTFSPSSSAANIPGMPPVLPTLTLSVSSKFSRHVEQIVSSIPAAASILTQSSIGEPSHTSFTPLA